MLYLLKFNRVVIGIKSLIMIQQLEQVIDTHDRLDLCYLTQIIFDSKYYTNEL
jgi:hypothetical protein